MTEWEIVAGDLAPDHPEYVYVARKGAADGSWLSPEETAELRACLGADGGVSLRNRVSLAIQTALEWGQVDGEHHLRWVISEMLADLADSDEHYRRLIEGHGHWDEGIAP